MKRHFIGRTLLFVLLAFSSYLMVRLKVQAQETAMIQQQLETATATAQLIEQVSNTHNKVIYHLDMADLERANRTKACEMLGDNIPYILLDICGEPKIK